MHFRLALWGVALAGVPQYHSGGMLRFGLHPAGLGDGVLPRFSVFCAPLRPILRANALRDPMGRVGRSLGTAGPDTGGRELGTGRGSTGARYKGSVLGETRIYFTFYLKCC